MIRSPLVFPASAEMELASSSISSAESASDAADDAAAEDAADEAADDDADVAVDAVDEPHAASPVTMTAEMIVAAIFLFIFLPPLKE